MIPADELPEIEEDASMTEVEFDVGREVLNHEMTSEIQDGYSSSEEEDDLPASKTADCSNSPHYREAILSLASIVADRLKLTHPENIGDPAPTCEPLLLPSWLQAHAKSDTSVPSAVFAEKVLQMDSFFVRQHGDKVDEKPGVLKRFVDNVAEQMPEMDR